MALWQMDIVGGMMLTDGAEAKVAPSYQVGSALGLAAMTAVACAARADQLGDLPALTDG